MVGFEEKTAEIYNSGKDFRCLPEPVTNTAITGGINGRSCAGTKFCARY